MKTREIKFRAWDKNDGMFYDVQKGILFDDGSKYIFENFINPKTDDLHEWTLMQYTGLKDKNGKEIYEGDLVSYRSYWKTAHKTSEKLMDVIFEEGRFQLRFLVNNNPAGDMMSVSQCGTVIGNIYENPELLK